MFFPVVDGRITQKFKPSHTGIDIAPPVPGDTSTPCLAPEAATVVESSSGKIEGNYVILQGAHGFYYFGHFEKRLVINGQTLKEGAPLGVLGQTGQATGIHTHHWIRLTRWAANIDPEAFYEEHLKEEPMKINRSEAIWLQRIITLNHNPTQKQIKDAMGRELEEFLKDRYNDGDLVENKKIVRNKYPAALKELESYKKPTKLKKGIIYKVEE